MMVHKELSGYSGEINSTKQLKEKDIINKTNDVVTKQCIHFEVALDFEYNNEMITQYFYFNRDKMYEKVWEVTTIIGDGGDLGSEPLRIKYEIPQLNFPLLKIAAMGLLYIQLTIRERNAYREAINYELLEKTNGI